jgi:hypothetical protein
LVILLLLSEEAKPHIVDDCQFDKLEFELGSVVCQWWIKAPNLARGGHLGSIGMGGRLQATDGPGALNSSRWRLDGRRGGNGRVGLPTVTGCSQKLRELFAKQRLENVLHHTVVHFVSVFITSVGCYKQVAIAVKSINGNSSFPSAVSDVGAFALVPIVLNVH